MMTRHAVRIVEIVIIFFSTKKLPTELIYENYRGDKYNELRDCYEPGYKARADMLNQRPEYLLNVEAWLSKEIKDIATMTKLDFGSNLGQNTLFKGLTETFDPFTTKKELTKTYDVVFCSHVLEHIQDPMPTIKKLFQLSQPMGAVYIETPLHGDPHRKFWHEHVGFFTENTYRLIFHWFQAEFKLKNLKLKTFDANHGGPMKAIGALYTR